MNFIFNFPKNRRAAESTLDEQLDKCREEFFEVCGARSVHDDRATLTELMDLYCATENAIRKFCPKCIEEIYQAVLAKGEEREDWL